MTALPPQHPCVTREFEARWPRLLDAINSHPNDKVHGLVKPIALVYDDIFEVYISVPSPPAVEQSSLDLLRNILMRDERLDPQTSQDSPTGLGTVYQSRFVPFQGPRTPEPCSTVEIQQLLYPQGNHTTWLFPVVVWDHEYDRIRGQWNQQLLGRN